jgi:hypothetical protein
MAFRCPICHTISENPNDEREAYCVRCHTFTSDAVRHVCRQCGTPFLARPDCPPICPDCYLASP